ncbi:probable G-protein coupled receptor 139 [Mya arenaria]|uniref:probable G-protein coupled receptor 139 n=1 Tax=Mya arenaria TaxID=6604 RepID=UPI0022E4C1BF|nr:probable G-protein coupled receptor 139 [Mya arenaria]
MPNGGKCSINVSVLLQQFQDQGIDEPDYMDVLTAMQDECLPNNPTALRREIWDDFPEYMEPNRILNLYVPPILLVLGTIGNLLTFIIMSGNMLKASTYSYLAVLAIMDILVLYVGLLRMWVGSFAIDIQHASNWLCKLVTFLGYVSSVTSVWLIIAVTIERFIAVKFPLRAPRICNVYRARVVILAIVVATCLLNMHIIWTVELQTKDHNGTLTSECEASQLHRVLVMEVWPWVDAAVYSLFPFVIISILNVLIVRCVLSARKQRSHMQNLGGTTKFLAVNKQQGGKRPNESSKKLTCMLLAVSFTFLITTLPMNILLLVRAFTEEKNKDLNSHEYKKQFAQMTLARTIVELLMYVNHSVNFFLYCATGRKFRREPRFRPQWRKRDKRETARGNEICKRDRLLLPCMPGQNFKLSKYLPR